jgi:hypothetical protein
MKDRPCRRSKSALDSFPHGSPDARRRNDVNPGKFAQRLNFLGDAPQHPSAAHNRVRASRGPHRNAFYSHSMDIENVAQELRPQV